MTYRTNEEIVEDYLVWLAGNRTKATVDSFKWALRQFLKWSAVDRCFLLTMKPSDFSRYIQHLKLRKLKPGTQAIYTTAVRSLWTWLDDQNLTPFKTKLLQTVKQENVSHYPAITEDEHHLILNSFSSIYPDEIRAKAVLSFLWDTGVRLGELISLNIGDINLTIEPGRAMVKTFKRKNHTRVGFFSKETKQYLHEWMSVRQMLLHKHDKESPALFIGLNSWNPCARIEKHAVQGLIRRLRKRCGLSKPVTTHSYRHGFCTHNYMNGMDIVPISKLAGHARINTTVAFYVHEDDSHLAEVYQKIREKKLDNSGSRCLHLGQYEAKRKPKYQMSRLSPQRRYP